MANIKSPTAYILVTFKGKEPERVAKFTGVFATMAEADAKGDATKHDDWTVLTASDPTTLKAFSLSELSTFWESLPNGLTRPLAEPALEKEALINAIRRRLALVEPPPTTTMTNETTTDDSTTDDKETTMETNTNTATTNGGNGGAKSTGKPGRKTPRKATAKASNGKPTPTPGVGKRTAKAGGKAGKAASAPGTAANGPKARTKAAKTASKAGAGRSATNGPVRRAASPKAAKADGGKPTGTGTGRAASGPREGSIIGIIVAMTKQKKSTEEIAKAVAKAHPKTVFAKDTNNGDYHGVAYRVWVAKQKKWL